MLPLCVPARCANVDPTPAHAAWRKPSGRLLERVSNGAPRGMVVQDANPDRIRLIGCPRKKATLVRGVAFLCCYGGGPLIQVPELGASPEDCAHEPGKCLIQVISIQVFSIELLSI